MLSSTLYSTYMLCIINTHSFQNKNTALAKIINKKVIEQAQAYCAGYIYSIILISYHYKHTYMGVFSIVELIVLEASSIYFDLSHPNHMK
jgi:hypothetical protein